MSGINRNASGVVSAQGFIELITIFRLAVGQQAWGCVPRKLKRQKRHHCVLSLFCLHMHTSLSSFAQSSKGKGLLGNTPLLPSCQHGLLLAPVPSSSLSEERALSLLWLCGAAPGQHHSKCKAVTVPGFLVFVPTVRNTHGLQ